jgi:hypothetical protein
MKLKPRHLIAALFLFAAPMAHAQNTAVTDFYHTSVNTGVTVYSPDSPFGQVRYDGTYANDFQTKAYANNVQTGNAFTTYCVDLFHYSNGAPGPHSPQAVSFLSSASFADGRNFGTGYSSNSTVQQNQRNGLGRAGWLAANVFLINDATINDQRAGLQIAIWKAEYETNSADFNVLNAGTIHLSSTAAAEHYALQYLNLDLSLNGGHFGTAAANLVSYHGTAQDQIALPNTGPSFSPVPEPASVAMWGTAFLVVSGLAYRNKRKLRVTN